MKNNLMYHLTIFKVLITDSTSYKFIVGVILSFSFSLAVILSTVGIMDGFVTSLKASLNSSNGDIIVSSSEGFFRFNNYIKRALTRLELKNHTTVVQTEGFALTEESSTGIVLKGIEFTNFSKVTDLKIEASGEEVIIGDELAQKFQLKKGDEIVLALASGNQNFSGLPSLYRFKVGQVIDHGVFQKDLRYVYMDINNLRSYLGLASSDINNILIRLPRDEERSVETMTSLLRGELDFEYSVYPFFEEYDYLIRAVRAEKVMISLILQIIVIIAIFNVIALILFLNERKSKELFLLKSLGLSKGAITRIWFAFAFFLWIFACSLSLILVKIFDYLLGTLNIFALPGDVYLLGKINVILDFQDYCIVFGLGLLWLLILSYLGSRRIRKQSLLYGLRKEFS